MKTLKISLLTFLAVFLVAGTSMSTPSNLYDITGIAGTDVYTDTLDEGFSVSDTDGTEDDATAFLLLEIAGFAGDNTFGIYGLNGLALDESMQIFAGADSAITSVTLAFDLVAGTVTNATTLEEINIDPLNFGFYITTPEGHGYTYYTHTMLNIDDEDHAMTFNTSDNSVGALMGSDIVVAFEDLYELGDNSFDDMVVGISDITPTGPGIDDTPVPEPATMFLLGTGLVGLAGARRKKNKR